MEQGVRCVPDTWISCDLFNFFVSSIIAAAVEKVTMKNLPFRVFAYSLFLLIFGALSAILALCANSQF